MKCFYHGDLDGQCSASIIAAVATEYNRSDFYEIDYNMPFPFDIISEGEKVVIVDWSLNQIKDGWIKLMAITSDIVWIDHHKSAIENCSFKFKGIRSTKEAACLLTYRWAHTIDLNVTEHVQLIPYYIRLLGDYDTWTFKYKEESIALQHGLKLYDTHPCSPLWKNIRLNNKFLDKVLGEGYIIKKANDNNNKFLASHLSYATELDGHTALACNAPYAGSKVFDSISDKIELYIVYMHTGTNYTVSLYANDNKDIDCSKIAATYGGGGHKGAAGFCCETLPFKKLGGDDES